MADQRAAITSKKIFKKSLENSDDEPFKRKSEQALPIVINNIYQNYLVKLRKESEI